MLKSILKPLAALAVAGTLAAPILAQGPLVSQDRLIGWTDPLGSSGATPGSVDWQDAVKCPTATKVCTNVLNRAVVNTIRYAGGTAYDPRVQAVWVSEGLILQLRKVRGCKVLCKFKARLINPKAGRVTGLAHSDAKPRLFQLESAPGYYGVVTYAHKAPCKLQAISKCLYKLPPKWTAAGLAYDETSDNLFVSVYDPANDQNYVYTAPASSPCKPVCKWAIPKKCPQNFNKSNQVFGLAYSACRKELYATYGSHASFTAVIYVFNPKCKFQFRRCCRKGNKGVYKGLAFVPGWKASIRGKSCTSAPCPNCPVITAGVGGGDSSLGNTAFSLTLSGAPAGGLGVPVLSLGPCTNGIPLFCGRFYPNFGALLILGPATPITGAGCNGSASRPVPLPNIPGLCGKSMCTQWAVFCITGAGFGIGLSRAYEFTVASS